MLATVGHVNFLMKSFNQWSLSMPRGEKSGQIRVNPGHARVLKSQPGSQPKNENGPFSMTRVALDPPFLTRATALNTLGCSTSFLTFVEIVKRSN